MRELTDNDRQRIERANKYKSYRVKIAFEEGAEYATIYERQQQAKELKRLTEIVERTPHLNRIVFLERQLDERRLEKEKLEAERNEVKNKVIEEIEDYCKNIQKLAEWWNDDPTLVERISGGHAAINRVLEYLNSLKK